MRRSVALAMLATLALGVTAQELPTAEELLARSIAYHDPEGVWNSTYLRLTGQYTAPDGQPEGSETWMIIDNLNGSFEYMLTIGGVEARAYVRGDECTVYYNGQLVTEEDSLPCSRLQDIRNQNLYLIGVPMKLRDAGTIVHPTASRTTFMGQEVLAIDVTYEPEVGREIWRFYFDPDTAALVGFRAHRESLEQGETVALDGELVIGSLRIPKTRLWYQNRDLDTLVSIETLRGVGNTPERTRGISELGHTFTEKNDTWWRMSYRFTVDNRSTEPLAGTVCARAVDADRVTIDEDRVRVNVNPGQSKEYTGFMLVRVPGARNVTALAVVPC
jgi:hypothetical protein